MKLVTYSFLTMCIIFCITGKSNFLLSNSTECSPQCIIPSLYNLVVFILYTTMSFLYFLFYFPYYYLFDFAMAVAFLIKDDLIYIEEKRFIILIMAICIILPPTLVVIFDSDTDSDPKENTDI